MWKLIVVICVVFCFQDNLAAPDRSLEDTLEQESSNTMEELEKEPEILNDDTESPNEKDLSKTEPKVDKSKDSEPNMIQRDTQGCIDQNIHTEVVNFMRDLSNFNIRVYDDMTNDVLSSRSQLADRLESEKIYFLSTINACTSIDGLSVTSCINLALEQAKPKMYILIADQFSLNTALFKEKKLQWTQNTFELMSIYGKFLTAIQQQDVNCP